MARALVAALVAAAVAAATGIGVAGPAGRLAGGSPAAKNGSTHGMDPRILHARYVSRYVLYAGYALYPTLVQIRIQIQYICNICISVQIRIHTMYPTLVQIPGTVDTYRTTRVCRTAVTAFEVRRIYLEIPLHRRSVVSK